MNRKQLTLVIVIFLMLAQLYEFFKGLGTLFSLIQGYSFLITLGNFPWLTALAGFVLLLLTLVVTSLIIIYSLLKNVKLGFRLAILKASLWFINYAHYSIVSKYGSRLYLYDFALILQVLISIVGLRLQ